MEQPAKGCKKMVRYKVKRTVAEREALKQLIQRDGRSYRIKHAQILLKLDDRPESKRWSYEWIKETYRTSNGTVAGVENGL